MFCVFEMAVYLCLKETICSPKTICSLNNFLLVYVYINKMFTLFRTHRRNRMSISFLQLLETRAGIREQVLAGSISSNV